MLPQQIQSSWIGLLVGSDYYHDIISSKKVKTQDGMHEEFEDSLQKHSNISDLWKLETVGINLFESKKYK